MNDTLIEVENLKTYFFTEDTVVPAIDGVSFFIREGETLGVVGESGCGKSMTALSIMRLVQSPPGRIVDGRILFHGEDLLKKSEHDMRKIRGNNISMIFQEPMTSLNPVYTCGSQIAEAIRLHQKSGKKEAEQRAIEMLRLVGIPDAERRAHEYPHQMSGGMRQRVMIAMALACRPQLLIADEPTTALDVTIQAQILDIIQQLKDELKTAVMLITHDLGVVAEMAERVIVMYAGKIVEQASVEELFDRPLHPYTQGLLHSIPKLSGEIERLNVIKGTVPNPRNMPQGCRFHPRCEYACDRCLREQPPLHAYGDNHMAACWLLENLNHSGGELK